MEIRQIRTEDANELVNFYNGLSRASKRTFRPLGITTTLDVCKKVIADNFTELPEKYDLVVEEKDEIVGWCFLWGLNEDAPTFGIGIADAFHGKGLGKRLMDAVMDFARNSNIPQVVLTVVQENEVAWKMYQRRGFEITGEFLDIDGLMYYRMLADVKKEN